MELLSLPTKILEKIITAAIPDEIRIGPAVTMVELSSRGERLIPTWNPEWVKDLPLVSKAVAAIATDHPG